MGDALQRRIGTEHRFSLGQEVMLALAVAAADLGAIFEDVFRDHGLTHTRYNVLRILRGGAETGLPHTTIAERLLVSSPDVTRLVDRLVDAGWVERQRSADDRRVVLHRLTAAGRELLDDLDAPLASAHRSITEALGASRARRLVTDCEAVITAVGGGSIHVLPTRGERTGGSTEERSR